jgi:AcrR family transcriptional regulator
MAARVGTTARGRDRRERLLNACAELVATSGFHAVGIIDIGAAAGVSGSALYRHFRTKTELLVALLDRVVDGLLEGSEQALKDAATAEDAIDRLIRFHAAFALRDRKLIAVWSQERRLLPEDDQRRLRRKQRQYVTRWADALRAIRPEMEAGDAMSRVQATFGLLNSVSEFQGQLAAEEFESTLRRMALAALMAA